MRPLIRGGSGVDRRRRATRGALPPAVLLGGQTIAVSVARSLGRVGVPVDALGDARFDTVGVSRHCRAFVDLGSGDGVQERWLDWLLDRRSSGPTVLLPCNDDALELVARNRSALVAAGYLPAELNDELTLAMLDKRRTYELARAAGVPTPGTRVLATVADLEAAAADFPFPCGLKPVHSHLFARAFGLGQKLFVAETPDDLRRIFSRTEAQGLEMILTEIVPGSDDRLASYWTYRPPDGGAALFEFTKRKLRQYPPQFGLGTYHITDTNPRIADAGRRFCEGIGLHGICNVEFKLDPRDDELKVIECNQRFTLANEILRHAGIDLALLSYRRSLGEPVARTARYRTGVRLWSPVEDARAFLEYRRRGELSARAWMGSLLHRQHFSLLSFTDPAPALASWAQLARRGAAAEWRAATRAAGAKWGSPRAPHAPAPPRGSGGGGPGTR